MADQTQICFLKTLRRMAMTSLVCLPLRRGSRRCCLVRASALSRTTNPFRLPRRLDGSEARKHRQSSRAGERSENSSRPISATRMRRNFASSRAGILTLSARPLFRPSDQTAKRTTHRREHTQGPVTTYLQWRMSTMPFQTSRPHAFRRPGCQAFQ